MTTAWLIMYYYSCSHLIFIYYQSGKISYLLEQQAGIYFESEIQREYD